MASSTITVRQTVAIDQVADVQVSEVVTVGDGTFKRAIRIYGAPDGAAGQPILELILVGEAKENIAITTPLLEF